MDTRYQKIALKIKVLIIFTLFGLMPAAGSHAAGQPGYRDQALKAMQQGDLNRAIGLLDTALADHSRDRTAYYIRGTLYLQLNKPQQALDDLQQAARLGGKWPHLKHKIALARLQLGKQAFVAGDNPTALVLLQLANNDIPEEFQPLTAYWLALALQRQQDDRQALEVLSSSLEQHPDTLLRPVLMRHIRGLSRQQKPRDWSMRLQAGIAFDDSVGLYPDAYFSPLWPNDRDYRGQIDFESYWRFRHSDTSGTTLSYRFFYGDYFKLHDYDTLQQAVALDHRIKTKDGNWGWNVQYIDADLGIDGRQNNQFVSIYQTSSPSIRRMSLKKLSLFHNEYEQLINRPYSGDGISGLYRYYFLKKGRNDRTYIGIQTHYYEGYDPIYTNFAYSLDLGFERSFWRFDYGFLMSVENRDYINRLNLIRDEHQTHKMYLGYNLLDNLSMELGIRHEEGDSSFYMSHYGRAIAYLVTRWEP